MLWTKVSDDGHRPYVFPKKLRGKIYTGSGLYTKSVEKYGTKLSLLAFLIHDSNLRLHLNFNFKIKSN